MLAHHAGVALGADIAPALRKDTSSEGGELLDLGVGERSYGLDGVGLQGNECGMFQSFETHVRFPQIFADRHRAVPFEHERVITRDEFPNAFRSFETGGCGIGQSGNGAEIVHDFGQNTLGKRDADQGAGNCGRWVGMDDGLNVRALPITFEVQANLRRRDEFARRTKVRADFAPMQINHEQLLGVQKPFAQTARRAQQPVCPQPYTQISVARSYEILFPHQFPDADNFFAQRVLASTVHTDSVRHPECRSSE